MTQNSTNPGKLKKFSIKDIDLGFLKLDLTTKSNFLDLLMFHISSNKPLNFKKFNTFIGISRPQWDNFKLRYKDEFKFDM